MTEVERYVGCERAAPGHLLRALRVTDPTAELLYMGDGVWWLGRIAPNRNIEQAGQRLAASCRRVERKGRKLVPEDRRRWMVAQARLAGFQATQEYHVVGEPTAAIVRDQEVMDFLHRTLSDEDRDRMADEDFVRAKAQAHADLTDDARGRDAWKYMFTRSHAVRRLDSPERYRPRAGRTLIRSVA